MAEYLLKIKMELDSSQFKAKAQETKTDSQGVFATAKVGFDSMAAKVTAGAFAFNQVTMAIGTAQQVMKPFIQAQTDMANVASLGVKNVDQLNTAIQEIASNKALDLHDLRQGLYQVVSAGVDASSQITVLDSAARAAKGGIATTSEALYAGSAVIKGYGMSWSQFETVMDKAFKTVSIGQTTFPELANSIGQVVPLASALKINVNELFGAFATLTGVTGNTNEVATQLRAVMQGLASPTKELTQLMKDHGHATVEQAVQSEGLAGVLKIIGDATGGSATKMNEFFGTVEATNAALALSTTQQGKFVDSTRQVASSTGEMNKAFETQNKTVESQWKILFNRITVIAENLLTIVMPLLKPVLDAIGFITKGLGYVANIGKALVTGHHWDYYLTTTNEVTKSTNQATTATQNYGNALNNAGNSVDTFAEAQAKLKHAQLEVDYEYQAGIILLDQYYTRKHALLEQAVRDAKKGSDEEIEARIAVLDFEKTVADKRAEILQKQRELAEKSVVPITRAKVEPPAPYDPSEDTDRMMAALDLSYEKAEINDQQYFDQKHDLLRQSVDDAIYMYGEDSKAAIDARLDVLDFEKNAERQKKELRMQGVQDIVSAGASLMNSAQGQNKTLFEIGKATSKAQALYESYAGARSAAKAVAGIPIVGPVLAVAAYAAFLAAGLMDIKKIDSIKWEKREAGGPVWENMPYLVGERGPELIVPRQNGTVIPNSAFESGSGMTGILDRMDSMVKAVKDLRIEFYAEIDALSFHRKNIPIYEKDLKLRTAF